MISSTLAKKYAKALLQIGLQEKNPEVLGKEFERTTSLLEHKELRRILLSSIYPRILRKAIAKTVMQSLEISSTVAKFIDLLISRGRMDHLPEIVKSYNSLCDTVSKRIRATLVSADKLSPRLIDVIKKQLESASGKEVILSVKEDSSLIGGVLIKMGDIVYDGSLKTQLYKIRENLY